MKNSTNAVRKFRERKLAEGERYIQIRLDRESSEVLERLKREMRMNRMTSEIVKKSLRLLLEQISING